jgi:hypothetical protein
MIFIKVGRLVGGKDKNQKVYEAGNKRGGRRGLPSLEKAQGLGPCSVGIHGFESHPPHILRVLFGI